jgi:hypothetical protein
MQSIVYGLLDVKCRTQALDAVFEPLYRQTSDSSSSTVVISMGDIDGFGGRPYTWDTLAFNLGILAQKKGKHLEVGVEDSVAEYVELLAPEQSELKISVIAALEEINDHSEVVSIPLLYKVAQVLDDGHGLCLLRMESANIQVPLGLGKIGGNGTFLSQSCHVASSSSDALFMGMYLDNALKEGKILDAADVVGRKVEELLATITDLRLRNQIGMKVAERIVDWAGETTHRRQFIGTFDVDGLEKTVNFSVPENASVHQIDSAFLDALSQHVAIKRSST